MESYSLPLFMSIGEGVFENLVDIIIRNYCNISGEKVLFLTTDGLLKAYEEKINKFISKFNNMEIIVVKESSFDFSVKVAKYVCTNDIKFILGFGGGTVLDTAKYASFVSKTIYIAIPTLLSNDGLASPISVLYTQNKKKKSFGSKIPDGLIIDTSIVANAPYIFLKAGIGDTVSNYTALYDWKLDCKKNGTKINDFSYMLSEMAFKLLLYSKRKSLKSVQCLKMLAQSLVLSGLAMEIAGNSRPCSGSEHLFCHAIDELYNIKVPHGILVALGSVVSCILQGRDNSILLDYLHSYDIFINPMNFGITRDRFVKAWMFAKKTRKERYTVLNNLNLTESMFNEIYDKLLEECK